MAPVGARGLRGGCLDRGTESPPELRREGLRGMIVPSARQTAAAEPRATCLPALVQDKDRPPQRGPAGPRSGPSLGLPTSCPQPPAPQNRACPGEPWFDGLSFSFLPFFLLKYSSHTIHFTILNCSIQCFLVYLQGYTTIATT